MSDSENDENSEFDDIKLIIKSYIFSAGSKCTEKDIRRDFFQENGENLDKVLREKFGLTLYQFAKRIPDVCKVAQVNGEFIFERISNEDSAHMDILKRGERRKRKPRKLPPGSFRFSCYRPFQSFNGNRRNFNNNQVGTMNKQIFVPFKPINHVPLRQTASNITLTQPPPRPKCITSNQHANQTLLCNKTDTVKSSIQLNMVKDCKNHVKEILLSNDGKCTELKLDKDFYRKTKKSFDSMAKDCGFQSNFELLKQMNDVCSVKKDSQCGLVIEIHSSLYSAVQATKAITRENYQSNPPSMPPVASEKVQHIDDCWRKPKFSDRYIENGGFVNKEIFNLHFLSDLDELPPSPIMIEKSEYPMLSTSKTATDLTDYAVDVLRIPSSRLVVVDQGKPRKIRMLQVTSPTKFTFQFNLEMLDKIMSEMQEHYSEIRNDLKIANVLPGMSVAANIEDRWFRAEVLYVDDSNVCVKLIDFNEVKHVKAEFLRYLKNSFCRASKMSAIGSLFNVKPKDNQSSFDVKSIEAFKDKLKESPEIYAVVEKINEDKIALSLYRDCSTKSSIANKLIANNTCSYDHVARSGQKLALE